MTNRNYQGWNVFLLNFITLHHEYKTPYFITYKQAMDAGGTIRRGQKGYFVVWWATIEDKSKMIDESGEIKSKTFRIPKCHTVFNIDQTFGIEFPKVEELFRSHAQKIQACDQIINNMPNRPGIKQGGDEAWYNRITDCINLPNIERFHSDEAYYKTKFHELAHSTGHQSRLNREELIKSDGFGNQLYSKEELTAELTAAFLSALCGIEQQTIINSAAYIQGWFKALQNDKRLILKAASQAQAATDYILNKAGHLKDLNIIESSKVMIH
jgi:antirestriction protein ArdC